MAHSNPRRRALLWLIMTVTLLLVLFSVGELAARIAIPPHKKQHPPANAADPMRRLFQYDSRFGWLPAPGLDAAIPHPAATIHVAHNSEGFRESEREFDDRRPEWSVFGDSQTWGYNVEAADRFSNRLDDRFPATRFRNYGVSGYGTAQQLLVYQQLVRPLDPRGVLLLFGSNDRGNNRSARTRAGYARPRFLLRAGELVLEDPVVPDLNPLETVVPWYRLHLLDALRYRWTRIRRWLDEDPSARLVAEFAQTVRADGRSFAVAIEDEDPEIVSLCKRLGVPVIELGPALARANEQQAVEFPRDQGRHWTPWGHRVVADAMAPWLEPHLP